ncbi:unnamed protein product [Camellia sinensis]
MSFASTSSQSIPSFTSKFVPPTTSASTSAAASASTSMHEVTSQASYLDTSSTDCCIANTTERKKGRGKSRSLALLKIKSQGKRLDVEICRITGNPLGPWSDKFTTELGIVTTQFAPQNVPKWSFISHEDKETLIAYLREGFIFSNEPYAIASILGMKKLRYKTYRFNLRQHFRSFPTMESALANPHEDIEKEVWLYLCQLWDDKTYQIIVEHTSATVVEEKCQKNKENRFKLKVLHTAGSKAFRKVQYDERDKDGKELGLVDLYHKTRFSQKRQAWVHNEAGIRHVKKLIERENEAIEDGSGLLSDEQLSIEVFGRMSGYISDLGRGPKPSTTASGRRTRAALEIENEETIRELEEQRRINEELNARVHNLESNSVEVNAKIDLVLQQISQGGCPKGVTPKYSLKPLVPSLSDIKPDIDGKRSKTNNSASNLPPGPRQLPLIGNLHQLAGSLPHHALRDLANKHGPLMSLQFGEVPTVIISSPEIAKEVMTTHDLIFATRPQILATKIMTYGFTNIAFAPYGENWRQIWKICTLELLSAKRIQSFRSIREEESSNFIRWIASKAGSPINLTQKIYSSAYTVTSRAAFGNETKDQESYMSIMEETVKAAAGFNIADFYPSAEWLHLISGIKSKIEKLQKETAMSEMMKNARIMRKAQAKVRQVFNGKGKVNETGIQELNYLKLVIKETLRLHPALPLLLPRECGERCEINGYEIPVKTKVIINVWAIGRDPNYWSDPECFRPERFFDSSIDFKGNNFEFIPFGAGRRICPGMAFGLANVEMPLAQFLYHFDWKLPGGMNQEELDLTEAFAVTVRRKEDLNLIAVPYKPIPN